MNNKFFDIYKLKIEQKVAKIESLLPSQIIKYFDMTMKKEKKYLLKCQVKMLKDDIETLKRKYFS